MDARMELEQILANLLDGPPDAARNQRLEELLRAHPELQGEYLDHLQLHALLQWRGGKVSAQDKQPVGPTVVQPAHWRSGRGVAAALLVLAASVALFFVLHTPEAQATPDLLETLVDWNLDLTQANSREERTQIYAEQAFKVRTTLVNAELPDEDRRLAESLLENSAWLSKNVDAAAEADRFNDIADKVVARMDAATTAQDQKRIVQLADAYRRLTEVGVDGNLERARALIAQDPEKKQRFMRSSLRHANRSKHVAEIIERNPEASRKLIHRAMKGQFHKTKKHQKTAE